MKRKRSRHLSSESGDEDLDHQKSRDKECEDIAVHCEICLKQFINVSTLIRHMQSHIAKRNCELCEQSFVKLQTLRYHQKKIHGVQPIKPERLTVFTCELCKKSFRNKYNLTRHRAAIHERLYSKQRRALFTCRHCESTFSDYDDLFRHVNENHPLNQQGGRRATTPPPLNSDQHVPHPNGKPVDDVIDNTRQAHIENADGLRSTNDESALRNGVRNRNIHPRGGERYDMLVFFGNIKDRVRAFLHSRLRALGGIKWNLCVQVEMQRDDGENVALATPFFRSLTHISLSEDDLNEHILNIAMQKMAASLEEFMREGSGWYVKLVLKLEIHTVVYKPLRGSTYIPLPKSLSRSRSLLNIQNQDNKCFLYCVLASLHPTNTDPKNVEHYRQYEHEINMIGITFPVTLSQVRKVENQNENISVNVFTYEDNSILPLRITEQRHRLHHVNLLWFVSGEKSHYCLITDLNSFLSRTNKNHNQMHFCDYCLHGFVKASSLLEHRQHCSRHGAQKVELPKCGENDILTFKDYDKTMKTPFVIYADFESINRKLYTCAPHPDRSATTPTSKLEVCGFGYKVVCENDRYTKPSVVYRGEDAGKKLIECLLREQVEIQEILSTIEPMHLTEKHDGLIKNATHCCICKKQFTEEDKLNDRIVRHHNHLTGEIIGPACNNCNLNCRQAKFVPVIFHNLKNFDAHILCENLGYFKDHRLYCIAQNSERYVSFSLGRLRFIDSFQFLPTSLESLVDNLAQDGLQAFPYLVSECKSEANAQLLLRKGVYPYDYMDSFDRFEERELPPKEKFYSTIKREHISDEDYEHAQTVFETFNMTSLGQYHDLYLKMDTVLLSQVFESFRTLCLKQYELDPCHFYTSPGLSWSACLKMTGVRLNLLTDIDKILMVEAGIRGGVSQISNRYHKANNAYLPDYDSSKPTTFLQYLDANNLYGWAMIQPLPIGDFVFMDKEAVENFEVMSVPENGGTGYILEVSLEYPRSLHDSHNSFPLAPVRQVISDENLSPYAQRLLRKLHGTSEDEPLPKRGKIEKLLTTLEDKDHYVLHYRNLQLYLRLGMKLKTVHRIMKFKQEAWMKAYIEHNTTMRKRATSTFQKNFYKLMNVSVFGKTMENVRSHKNIELVHTEERLKKVTAKPTYKHTTIFNEDLVAIELHKAMVKLSKPIYCGMSILDLSKCLMYEFWYNYIKEKYKESAQLQLTDTDSFLFSCVTDDLYEDMNGSIDHFDTYDYPKEHVLHSERNKKVLGKMKDETNGQAISEFIGLRSKMYSFLCNGKEEKRAKGIAKVTVAKELKHVNYKNTIFDETSTVSSMSSLKSHGHELFNETIQKKGLSAFDDKRYLIDAVNSYAYGHYKIVNDASTVVDNIENNQTNISIIHAKDDFIKCNDNWNTLKAQAFTIDGFKITPCEKKLYRCNDI